MVNKMKCNFRVITGIKYPEKLSLYLICRAHKSIIFCTAQDSVHVFLLNKCEITFES